jgi:hypothetical protein
MRWGSTTKTAPPSHTATQPHSPILLVHRPWVCPCPMTLHLASIASNLAHECKTRPLPISESVDVERLALTSLFSPETRRPSAMATFPRTAEQIEEDEKTFIDSIDPGAICRLASLYNGSKTCRIFRNAAHGSYNVCYFVEFEDGVRWVVRIPLEPSIANVWDKVQSEVATIRWVELILLVAPGPPIWSNPAAAISDPRPRYPYRIYTPTAAVGPSTRRTPLAMLISFRATSPASRSTSWVLGGGPPSRGTTFTCNWSTSSLNYASWSSPMPAP